MTNRDSKGRFIKGMKMPKDLAKKSAKARTKYTPEELVERKKQYSNEWHRNNPEKAKAKYSKYRQNNKAKIYASNAIRRLEKINRTPSWLSEDDLNEIKNMYAIAQRKSQIEGRTYHVDHIIPLKGKNVSGLHVPSNLQIITASENVRKNNIFEGDSF